MSSNIETLLIISKHLQPFINSEIKLLSEVPQELFHFKSKPTYDHFIMPGLKSYQTLLFKNFSIFMTHKPRIGSITLSSFDSFSGFRKGIYSQSHLCLIDDNNINVFNPSDSAAQLLPLVIGFVNESTFINSSIYMNSSTLLSGPINLYLDVHSIPLFYEYNMFIVGIIEDLKLMGCTDDYIRQVYTLISKSVSAASYSSKNLIWDSVGFSDLVYTNILEGLQQK